MRHNTSANEDISFKDALTKQLQDAEWVLDWIENNFEVEDVFEDDRIKAYVKSTFNPEDVFDDDELEQWAKDNGLVKPEE
jgi:hypothetical protein